MSEEPNAETETKAKTPPAPPKKRGRPKGSTNKKKDDPKKDNVVPLNGKGKGDSDDDPRLNEFDPDLMASIVEELDVQYDKLDTMQSEYMSRCKGPRSKISEIISAAKDEHGISTKALKAFVDEHLTLRKLKKRQAKLADKEPDIHAELSMIRKAADDLKGLPFGEWLEGKAA